MILSVPFPNSYWVIPGKFLAGHYPGSEDPTAADKRLKALVDHGLRTFIDLMEPGEVNWGGRPFGSKPSFTASGSRTWGCRPES